MCGEHSDSSGFHSTLPGSSPHVRGARSALLVAPCVPGIIPACAGSTKGAFGIQGRHWDHPRMCGEHSYKVLCCTVHWGSSPHVRGALLQRQRHRIRAGIIPACAGSTWSMAIGTAWDGDHPRMCGEHRISVNTVSSSAGSSPHVRGAQIVSDFHGLPTGIIPACAGSTFDMIEILRQIGDHPRMCGEHVRRQSVRQLLTGIIPACAGSTQTHRLHDQPRRDHPRMCGEHDVRPDRRQS